MYCDTSVFGGYFEEGFRESTRQLFELIRNGSMRLIVSDITLLELRRAPDHVRALLGDLPEGSVEQLLVTEEIGNLRDAYLKARIVGPASDRDAGHIASATVAKADLIVSWNFKHIVHFEKIRGYHGVNKILGYPEVPIHSPLEVI